MNSIGWIEGVAQDLRFAFRLIRRDTGFAVATIGTLALGIGATPAGVQRRQWGVDPAAAVSAA